MDERTNEPAQATDGEKAAYVPPAPASGGRILREFLPVLVTEVVLSGLMLLVYALIGRWSVKVLLGGLLGTAAELLNFTVMTFSLLRAEQAETPQKGQLAAKGNYLLRMAVLLAVLIGALVTGYFDPLATLLPLCFMRIALFTVNLKRTKKEV